MGQLLRKLAYDSKDVRSNAVKKAMESGKGASDKLILSIYKENMKTKKQGVVFDGNPGGKFQAQKTIELLRGSKIENIFCIRLICSKRICIKRILARDNSIRKDGSIKIINKRFKWYRSKVMDGYKIVKKNSQLTIILDSSQSITTTFNNVINSFQQIKL